LLEDNNDTEQTALQKAAAERKEVNLRKKKRGRPKKSAVVAKKQGNRGQVGRPKGDAAIINEYKARMLASPKSAKVLEKIWEAALDDDHKHQAAAWKLVIDRVLPTSLFDKDANGGSKPSINITIGTVGSVDITESDDDDVIEGEVE
jgi:hypothetical protein